MAPTSAFSSDAGASAPEIDESFRDGASRIKGPIFRCSFPEYASKLGFQNRFEVSFILIGDSEIRIGLAFCIE